jgi:hypothetical protein
MIQKGLIRDPAKPPKVYRERIPATVVGGNKPKPVKPRPPRKPPAPVMR